VIGVAVVGLTDVGADVLLGRKLGIASVGVEVDGADVISLYSTGFSVGEKVKFPVVGVVGSSGLLVGVNVVGDFLGLADGLDVVLPMGFAVGVDVVGELIGLADGAAVAEPSEFAVGVGVVSELIGLADGLAVAGVDVTGAAVLANAFGFVVVGLDVWGVFVPADGFHVGLALTVGVFVGAVPIGLDVGMNDSLGSSGSSGSSGSH
jgi:hypothetical protein